MNSWLNELAADWWTWTVTLMGQSGVVILLALAIAAWGRRWSAHVRYAILLLPLLKLVVPPIAFNVSLPAPAHSNAPESVAPLASPAPRDDAAPEPDLASASHAISAALSSASVNWKTILFLIYGSGVFIAAAALSRRFWHVRGVIRRAERVRDPRIQDLYHEVLLVLGMKRGGELLSSSETPGPVTVGVFRNCLLLPSGVPFGDAELRSIFAHEAAHMRRRDLLVDFIQRVIQMIWWFNPLVWALNRQIRSVREECCDELLLAREAVERDQYCDTLIGAARTLARTHAETVGVGIATKGHSLSRRIARILDPKAPMKSGLPFAHGLSLLVAGSIVLPNLRVVAEPAREAAGADFGKELFSSWESLNATGVVLNGEVLNGVDWPDRDLKNAALCNASLEKANLAGADLRNANLAGAKLRGAILSGAKLDGANLTGADLTGATLRGTSLTRAWLSGTQLDGANLENANLDWAFLRGAKVSGTTLIASKWKLVVQLLDAPSHGRILDGADLSNANLSKVVFVLGRMQNANLAGADLSHASLHGTAFPGAVMKGVNLEGSDLDGASLRRADLTGANLTKARLSQADLSSAILIAAKFPQAKLEEANLAAANLDRADLRWAGLRGVRWNEAANIETRWRLAKDLQENGAQGRDLTGMDLSELDLARISFRGAILNGANLSGALLRGSDFSEANLDRANLNGTQLGVTLDARSRLAPKWRLVNGLVSQGAGGRDLSGVDLSYANLSGAQMQGAILRRSNLEGAILDATNLQSAILDDATLDKATFHNTVMPDGSIRSHDC